MRFRVVLSAAALVLAASLATSAFAQGQNANAGPRLLGNVERFDGKILVVKIADGTTTSVTVPADLRIVGREKGSLAAIKAGDFVGSAADESPDGKLHAEEVHIMDGALRGVGEGHRPMAANATSSARTMTNATVAEARSMTNATVAGVSGGAQTRVLKMEYPGGVSEIEVAPDTPITRMSVGGASLLKPGAAVTVGTTKADAGLVANQMFVDTDQNNPR